MTTTIVMGVMDEIVSLNETIKVILSSNEDIEILFVISDKTTKDARQNLESLIARNDIMRIWKQTKPGVGNAYREGLSLAKSSFVLMMSSDMETDPSLVKSLIYEISNSALDVVVVSRWRNQNSFNDYNKILLLANWFFQKTLRFMYKSDLTDLTYAFRIYKQRALIGCEDWKEERHGFFLESILKPLNNGMKVGEISGSWKMRDEGVRHIQYRDYLTYVSVMFRCRQKKSWES